MASESSSSMLFFGITGGADNMELMTNSQQESPQQDHNIFAPKKKRNQPQASYPNADIVIAVSPTTLLDSNRFVCEVCYKGFSRKQNLTLHRRAHNLPFTLKTKTPKDPVQRKVYLCPEPTCVHHNRSHALGDFGGLKKHYLRKHYTEKIYKCDTCHKAYSVESDLRAHSKICTRKKYMCRCGCGFSRGYHFIVNATKDPQTLNIGECSVKTTRHNNNNIPIGLSMSHPPTLGTGDHTIRVNRSENSSIFIGPSISSIKNQFNSYPCTTPYQSQLCQFGSDHSSLLTYPSMDLNFDATQTLFPPTSSHHNQQAGCRENLDIGLYADILMDKIPLQNMNLNTRVMGDCGYIYGHREVSKSFLDGGFMLDPSNPLNLTPAMHATSQYGMMNPLTGSCDECYGDGNEPFNYRDGMEGLNYETTGGSSLAPSEQQYPNQQGFWC